MVGLFALFYASAHFLVWVVFLLGLQWGAILEEVVERPYITVGFSSFVILVALGVTSPRAMVRRLGKNWRRLHVYVAGVLAVVHLVWIVRTDLSGACLWRDTCRSPRMESYFRRSRARGTPGMGAMGFFSARHNFAEAPVSRSITPAQFRFDGLRLGCELLIKVFNISYQKPLVTRLWISIWSSLRRRLRAKFFKNVD